ncbi:hypothetical protein Q4I30_001930 [Leishmania utingensis]|uniref:Uncharacterized protein n=1 Tax=Leishmania utingensis TaxID=653362 RepID=A0AAW3ARY2_9TRYP
MPVQTQTQRGPRVTSTGVSTGKNDHMSATKVLTVKAMAASMEHFLDAQEAALERMLDSCRSDASQAPSLWRFSDAAAAAQLQQNVLRATGSNYHTVNLPTDDTAADDRRGTSQTHRASVMAELFKQEKASRHALAAGQWVTREAESLRRTAELAEDKLCLAQARNQLLRGRLAKLTRERRKGTRHVALSHDGSSADVVGCKRVPIFPIDSTPNGHRYTNDIVEARRQLDLCTKELEESQLRLHQLQEYHLGQLSGHLRPMVTANDALRTTENFLDPDTSMAVRATVVNALLEVNGALKPLPVQENSPQSLDAALPCLDNVTTLWDRLAVQNFVVGRINRLFTCMCPTAPPLTLLKDTCMM